MNKGIGRAWLALVLWIPLAAGAAGLDPEAPMDEATARAMLLRIGYGPTPASLAAARQMSPKAYVQRAIREPSRVPPAVAGALARMPVSQPLDAVWERLGPPAGKRIGNDEAARKVQRKGAGEFASATVQARLLVMANGDNPGREALLAFWLNHFSVYAPKGHVALLAHDYARALEEAMREDSFLALLRASFMHPAMQVYLDNTNSTAPDSVQGKQARGRGKAPGINENLAREVLELHTLGVDAGYTQRDVQELARIITGAGIDTRRGPGDALLEAGATRHGLFLFDPRRHDPGAKVLLGTEFPAGQGMAEVERALALLAVHPATARRLSLKLARRFLDEDPPDSVVSAMSAAWLRSNGRISETLAPLLASKEFATALRAPQRYKEPLDYLLSVARAACGDTPILNADYLLVTAMDLGQVPFMRTTPDGYPVQDAAWLSPVAMARRARLALAVADGEAPLASAAGNGKLPGLQALAQGRFSKRLRGEACTANEADVRLAVGTPGEATGRELEKLSGPGRVAVLLASPEFMHR